LKRKSFLTLTPGFLLDTVWNRERRLAWKKSKS